MPTPGDAALEQTVKAAAGGRLEGGWQENVVASFFNAISAALEPSMQTATDQESQKKKPHRHWLAKHSNRRMPGNENGAGNFDRHPDLILLESAEYATESISWVSPVVLAEYTSETWKPTMRLTKTLHTKSYLTFLDQPWRRYVLCISICKRDFRVHFYDRSGVCLSPPFDISQCPTQFVTILAAITFGPRICVGFDQTITVTLSRPLRTTRRKVAQLPSKIPATILEDGEDDTSKTLFHRAVAPGSISRIEESKSLEAVPPRLGRIRVNAHWYEIIDVLFLPPGFLGRGTIIYLARHDGQTCVIKDHWVENAGNEAKMMKYVKGIPGVPEVVEHWQVEVVDSIVDTTSRYRPEWHQKHMIGKRTHARIVMSPCGRALTQFKSKNELIRCIRDVLQGE